MKYEYLKGGDKDFNGAPDWAELVYMGDVRCFVGRNGRWKNEGSTLSFNEFAAQLPIGKMPKLIAERQPISESSWDGLGLPPVGCECEYMESSLKEWNACVIDYVGSSFVVYRDCCGVELTGIICNMQFRPRRSEADNKRDAAIRAIDDWLPEYTTDNPSLYHATAMYDAIAAGSIPGVKLED